MRVENKWKSNYETPAHETTTHSTTKRQIKEETRKTCDVFDPFQPNSSRDFFFLCLNIRQIQFNI